MSLSLLARPAACRHSDKELAQIEENRAFTKAPGPLIETGVPRGQAATDPTTLSSPSVCRLSHLAWPNPSEQPGFSVPMPTSCALSCRAHYARYFPDGCDHAAGWTDSTHACIKGSAPVTQVPPVFMTDLSGNRHIALASGAGEVDYLTKPTNMRNCSTTSGVHFANACTARSVCTAAGAAAAALGAPGEEPCSPPARQPARPT